MIIFNLGIDLNIIKVYTLITDRETDKTKGDFKMTNQIEELTKQIEDLKRVKANIKQQAIEADQANEWGYQGDYAVIIDALSDKITATQILLQRAEIKGNDEDLIPQFFEK